MTSTNNSNSNSGNSLLTYSTPKKFNGLILTNSNTNTFFKTIQKELLKYEFLNLEPEIILPKKEEIDKKQFNELKCLKMLEQIDILFFNPNCSLYFEKVVKKIRALTEEKRLALVFFRGIDEKSGPYVLNFTTENYVDWGYSNSFFLYLNNFYKINFFNKFIEKHKKIFENFEQNNFIFNNTNTQLQPLQKTLQKNNLQNNDTTNTLTELKIKLEQNFDKLNKHNVHGDFINSLHLNKIKNLETDWTILGFGKDDGNEIGASILLNLNLKVLFPHYYGFSFNDDLFSKDLTKVLIAYLLMEHLNDEKGKRFKENLVGKIDRMQCWDVVIVCNDFRL
ncbi:hypothetical protein ABK040_007552 [Willaertia magna]